MSWRLALVTILVGLVVSGCATPRGHVRVTLDLTLCDLLTGHWYGSHGRRYHGHCQGESEADFMLGYAEGQRARAERQQTLRQAHLRDNYAYSLAQLNARRDRLLSEGGQVAELADLDEAIARLERRQRQASVNLRVSQPESRIALQ